jgi:hypothetical protein
VIDLYRWRAGEQLRLGDPHVEHHPIRIGDTVHDREMDHTC